MKKSLVLLSITALSMSTVIFGMEIGMAALSKDEPMQKAAKSFNITVINNTPDPAKVTAVYPSFVTAMGTVNANGGKLKFIIPGSRLKNVVITAGSTTETVDHDFPFTLSETGKKLREITIIKK